MARQVRIFAALVVAIFFAALAVPACVLQIDQGGVGGDAGPTDGTAGGAGAAGNGGAAGGDTSGDVDPAAFVKADQERLALRAMTAAYAATATQSLVEAQLADPSNPDPTVVEQLIAQEAPAGWDAALQWLQSVDPSTLSIEKGVLVKDECLDEPYLCKRHTWCPFGEGNIGCAVSQCGTGKCPWCPFGGNLVFKAWCAYGCIRNSDGEVVGGAFVLRTVFDNYSGPFCIKF